MRHHRISGLPVVDGDERPVGILTNRDVRFEKRPRPAGRRADDEEPGHGAGGRAARRGARSSCTSTGSRSCSSSTAAASSRASSPSRTSSRPSAPDAAAKDELRPPARRRGGRRRRRSRRARSRRCSRPAATSSASTPRTATRAACSRRCAATRKQLPEARSSSPATSPPPRRRAALIEAGADAVKVGIGPGSICTTRDRRRRRRAADHRDRRLRSRRAKGSGVPIIADGGIKYSGDVAKALAAGADTVMIGCCSPAPTRRPARSSSTRAAATSYRGMGSIGAMKRRRRRTATSRPTSTSDAEARARGHRGPRAVQGLAARVALPAGRRPARRHGLHRLRARSTSCARRRGSCGSRRPGLRESHVHDVIITKEAPNYRVE